MRFGMEADACFYAASVANDSVRIIGQIESEAAAQRFHDFLYVQKIPNQIELDQKGAWDIWVHSDDDLAQATELLKAFHANPGDAKYQARQQAAQLRNEEEKDLKRFQKKVRTRGELVGRFAAYGVGPLTLFLICACVLVYILKAADFAPIRFLYFSEYRLGDLLSRALGSPEIRSGQIWRLVTPMLLHFGIIHILFNMMWLRDLGGMIETVEGTGKLLVFVIVSAAISNWAQYVVTGNPLFGGMSGVVYALLGYVWIKGKFQPGSGFFLHKQTVTMMLIWLVVCFTGLLGPIANYAHLGGLITGVVWGFMETRRV